MTVDSCLITSSLIDVLMRIVRTFVTKVKKNQVRFKSKTENVEVPGPHLVLNVRSECCTM